MPFPWLAGMRITAARLEEHATHLLLQDADMVMTNQTALLNTDIQIPLEPGAVYEYDCMIRYSARSAANSALLWAWDSPVTVSRHTQSYIAEPGINVNTGSDIIQRSPANVTQIPAGGSDNVVAAVNFHSAYDKGTIAAGTAAGLAILQVRQQGSGSANQTILRAGTRCIYRRIA